MNVSINVVYVAALVLYSIAVTWFWVCSLFRCAKEQESRIMELESLRMRVKYLNGRLRSPVAERESSALNEREANKVLLRRIGTLEGQVDSARGASREIARRYVKLQNEYAYYRILMRGMEPDAHSVAMDKLRKGEAGSDKEKVV